MADGRHAKGGRRYRTSVCQTARKRGRVSCPTTSVPAAEVERFVVDPVRAIGRGRDLLDATLVAAQTEPEAAVRRVEEALPTLRARDGRRVEVGPPGIPGVARG